MSAGNKIEMKDIGKYEVKIAKCGWVHLLMIADPIGLNTYRIERKGVTLLKTYSLREAIGKYNELVQ